MLTKTIEAVIFDFGGVLIDINYQLTIDAFKSLGIDDFDALYSQASQSDLFNAIETGAISPNEFIEGVLKYLPANKTAADVVSAWNAMILEVPKQSVEVLQSLSKHYRVFLLSNTNAIHLPFALKAWEKGTSVDFLDCFEKVYLSHEIGMRKPDKEIFEYVCNYSMLDPKNTLFIDDSIQHIRGAESLGIQTHHLKGIQDLSAVFS
ncbi:MAG: HAD superfamily hydrolase (TIGR01509 family) [Flavobacteriaceae bacterium]|jgi:HAD superfamily hydrolase (TIGR01509 family)